MSGEVLVLGATGKIGRRVAARLGERGVAVRAAARSAGVRFDWGDRSTWRPAVAGARAMFLMAPDGAPVEPDLVRLAVDEGVRRIVLLSSRAIEPMGDERLIAAERPVRESGAEWTIVRASWFAQNFDEGFFQPAVMAGEVAMPLGDVAQAFVDAGDIAAVAAAALAEDGHAGELYEVTGPRALPFAEAVATIARAAGRDVVFRGDDESYRAAMSALGIPAAQIDGELAAFAALRALGDEEPTDTVRRVAGREPRDFADYAAAAAAAGAWR